MVRSRIDATRCVNASSLASRRAISVTIQPGQTAFTVIPGPSEFHREPSRQDQYLRLRRGVERRARERRADGGVGRNIDDPAVVARLHSGHDRPHGVDHAVYVHCTHALKLRRIVGLQRGGGRHTGVVDQDRHRSEFSLHLGEHSRHGSRIGDVGL